MAKDVIMPVLGMNQDTAVLLAWLKQEGERVEKGEPIMEVETDKATMELDAPASGTLSGVRAAAGDEVQVGSVVAVILADGEAAPSPADAGASAEGDEAAGADAPAAPASRDGAARAPAATEAAAATDGRAGPDVAAPRYSSASGIVPASPKARRLAGERGVALEALRGRGRGPEGAVLAADVMEAAARPAPVADAGIAPPALRFERTLAAGALLTAVAWAQHRLRDDAAGGTLEVGDLVARFLAGVWSRQPLAGADPGPETGLRYRRVADGRVSDVHLRLAEAASLPAVVRARAAAGAASDAEAADTVVASQADVALLDLSGSRADLTPASVPRAAGLVDVVVGRLHERVLPVDGAPTVARGLTLAFAFDAARVDVAEAAAFCDRLIALVEEPAALALLY